VRRVGVFHSMRKEKYEANLAQIEKDIETLSRKVVLVADED
jgi:hypothetical protein